MTEGRRDAAALGFADQVKLWYELLHKGFGLLASLLGGLSLIAPWVQPFTPKVLNAYMTALTIVSFLALTFWAASLRVSSKGPRRGAATIFFVIAFVMFFAFLWLLDAAPRWALLDSQPHLVRGVAALPYGLMIGTLCAGLALLTPATEQASPNKNAA